MILRQLTIAQQTLVITEEPVSKRWKDPVASKQINNNISRFGSSLIVFIDAPANIQDLDAMGMTLPGLPNLNNIFVRNHFQK